VIDSLALKGRQRCALVLGMHNSGTSLLGNLMHASGLPLGPDLLLKDRIPEATRPRYDYFEDETVVKLQDSTLLSLQRHWSSYRAAFTLPPIDHPARERFRESLRAVVAKRFERETLWLVKDPRSAVLVEDWLNVLSAMEVEPRLLVVHRDPLSNIRSFSSKGQVPLMWAEALWQRTYANATTAAATLPAFATVFTSFEALLSSPNQEIKRLCEILDWPIHRSTLASIQKRVDLSLPTERWPDAKAAEEGSTPKNLHPATIALSDCLNRDGVGSIPELLATAMQESCKDKNSPLQLNTELFNGQTLQPKVSVVIVTAELQGWGAGGGIGSAFHELALCLAQAGHRVRVMLVQANQITKGDPLPGIEIQHLNTEGLTRLETLRRVAEALRKQDLDVVHLHDWLGLGSGLKQALEPNPPKILVGLHGPSAWTRTGNPWVRSAEGGLVANEKQLYDEGLVLALEMDALNQSDWWIAPSDAMAQWVTSNLCHGQHPTQLLVNRNCPLSKRLKAKPNIDTSGEQIDCVYFGRLEQRKGLSLLLEALLMMGTPPRHVLFLGNDCVVGQTDQGSELWGSELAREKLEKTQIRLTFEAGLLRDEALERLIALQAVVVIPSLIENSPCVVEELLDSGLSMVVCDVGGIAEMVRAQDCAFLSSAAPQALAKHLQNALAANRHGSNGYQLSRAIEDWKIQLSWQAFHERLPRRHSTITAEQKPAEKTQLWRRAINKAHSLAARGKRRLAKIFATA